VLDAIRSYQEAVNKQLQYSEAHAAADDRPARGRGPVRRHADGGVRAPRPKDIKFRETPSTPPDLDNIADRA
jgi:hypothetical protein